MFLRKETVCRCEKKCTKSATIAIRVRDNILLDKVSEELLCQVFGIVMRPAALPNVEINCPPVAFNQMAQMPARFSRIALLGQTNKRPCSRDKRRRYFTCVGTGEIVYVSFHWVRIPAGARLIRAYSILTGIAANMSIETGQMVTIDDIINNLKYPDYPEMSSNRESLPMPKKG